MICLRDAMHSSGTGCSVQAAVACNFGNVLAKVDSCAQGLLSVVRHSFEGPAEAAQDRSSPWVQATRTASGSTVTQAACTTLSQHA